MGHQNQVSGHPETQSEMGHPVGQTSLEELKRLAGKVLLGSEDMGHATGQERDTEDSREGVPSPRPLRAGHGTSSPLASANLDVNGKGGEESSDLDPLPPEGDPRRAPLELIDQVWAAGGWLVIAGAHVRAVPRDAAVPSPRLSPNLLASVEAHQEELLRALTRI
jgi:hypothetical protein